MVISVYCVRDSLLGFGMPILRDNDAVASRAFDYDLNIDGSPMASHPQDFQLYRIGFFDTDTGIIDSESPVLVASAIDFIKGEKDD